VEVAGRIEIRANVRVQPSPRASLNVMTVRILVVDDHPVVRHGLRTLLGSRPEWEIIGEAADGIEAVDKAHSLKPDVILLDVSMPRMDGLEACRRIRKIVPESEILIVTQHDSPQMMREAISAGAKGYVVKSNVARDLPAAVEAVSQHRPFTSLSHDEAGGSD
jgi:DNA-binding NarL/FixJ family response regulator